MAIGSEPSFFARAFNWARAAIQADIDARVEKISGLNVSSDPELDRAFQLYFDQVQAARFFAERGFFQGDRAIFIYLDASKQEKLAVLLVTKENPQDIFPQTT